MTLADLPALNVAELRKLLQAREVSPREVFEALQARIAEIDPKIDAYLSANFDDALTQAEGADLDLPLGGVPIALKDIISLTGEPCTCASKILRDYRATYDATVVRKLKAAGAIPFGKTNMDEFAMGSSTENSGVKPTRNPWDRSRVPGGSSGGSAAAVAADIAFAALGTDTGGSVRQPAALSGVVGLKPSYGRVSRFGLVAFASSLDQAGPLTKTVRDAALLLNAVAGPDPQDSTSLNEAVPDYTANLGKELRGVRLGLPKEYMIDGIDAQVRAAVEKAVVHFQSLGAEIVDVSLPHTEYAVATYYMIASAEASANLARFDGVRYGHRAENPRNLLDLYGRTREEGFGPEVKRRIILGTYVLSAGYYDAYYQRAQKVRELIRRDFVQAFAKVDALISPTSPDVAFPLGERSSDPLRMYLADIFTIAANLAGICGISLPCGFAQTEEGMELPIGLQLLGKPLDEAGILQIAHAYEDSTDWHRKKPPLAANVQRPTPNVQRPTSNSEGMMSLTFADRMNRQSVFRIVLWFFGLVLLVFTIVPVLHCLRGHSIKDYRVWYETGQLVLHGAEVYPNQWNKFPFMYPPPCALFLAPLSALGKLGLIIVLTLVNAAAWFCTITFSARLATGEWRRGHVLLYLIPNLVMGAHIWGNFLLGQPSLVLLALMLGAFLALRQQLNVLAGVLIALAAAIKAFPVIAIVYLVYRRYWRAAAAMALTVVFLLIVLPIPFRGYDLAKQDLERWSSGMLFKYDETGVGQRLGRSNSWKNQSVWGVANRLLRHVEYDHKYAPHTPAYANFVDLEFKTVNQIILATALVLGVAFIAVMPATRRRTQETDAIEFALLLLLILMFTPLSFGYLFAWLIYPLTVVVQRLLTGSGSRTLLGCGIAAVMLLALSIPFRVMAQVYGNALLATFLLFVGLATELWRVKRAGLAKAANQRQA